MKLLRYGEPGQEKPGIMDDQECIRDLSSIISDIDGSVLSASSLNRLRDIDLSRLPLVEKGVRFGPCVGSVGKFLCIGLNYSDHAEESGMPVPLEPVVFSKFTSAICGPNDNVVIPRNSKKTDWEVELGIVIGKDTAYVTEEDAEESIAGYCVINDISEREFQLERSGQWDLGKGCDTFGPTGPWLVTREDVKDVENLELWLEVNGERVQQGHTSRMIFKPAYIVSYLSQFLSLQPGDIISTGTPAGVGLGFNPPRFLKSGDNIKLGIELLGEQHQVCVPWE